jgi:hypothetical protein
MKVVEYFESKYSSDHPTGAVSIQHMLRGELYSPDNFMYILGRQDADFSMAATLGRGGSLNPGPGAAPSVGRHVRVTPAAVRHFLDRNQRRDS